MLLHRFRNQPEMEHTFKNRTTRCWTPKVAQSILTWHAAIAAIHTFSMENEQPCSKIESSKNEQSLYFRTKAQTPATYII
jgi:hypothetical protein